MSGWKAAHEGHGWYWVRLRTLAGADVYPHLSLACVPRYGIGARAEPTTVEVLSANGGRIVWLLNDLPKGMQWLKLEKPEP